MPCFARQILFQPVFEQQKPMGIIFDVPAQICKHRTFLVGLLLQLCNTILCFMSRTADSIRQFGRCLLPHFKQLHRPGKQSLLVTSKYSICFLRSVRRFLHRYEKFFRFQFLYLPTESLQTPCFPLNLHFKILQTLFQLFLLISQSLFHVEQTLFLLENVALPAGQLKLTAARFFLFDLPLKLLPLLIHICKVLLAFSSFQFPLVDLCLRSFFFCPPYQKLLDLAAVYGLVHLLIQPADLLQRIQLFLLTLRQQFVPFIIPDVLLHQLNIGLIRNIADVLRNKFLDIHNWPERNSLLHHP